MKKMALILMALLFPAFLYAADVKQEVKLFIAADQGIESLVNSYVRRELREIKDLEIVQTQPFFWFLDIVCIEIKTKGGDQRGYALSAVPLLNTLHSKWETVGLFEHHFLYVGDDLKQLIVKLIADFDSKCLEKMRQGI